MIALISDIHGNLEALTAVLDDIAAVVEKSEAMCGKGNRCAVRLPTGR
jgi:hypothetical protein